VKVGQERAENALDRARGGPTTTSSWRLRSRRGRPSEGPGWRCRSATALRRWQAGEGSESALP